LVESTIKEVLGLLVRGDVDVNMEMWKSNNQLWFEQGVAKGDLLDLGLLYTSGKQYWIVSEWYAAEHGIVSVFDMKHHWQDFVDPSDPSKGVFFNCIIGWSCRDINRVKLKAYGLDRYYNTISPLSPESLDAIYENSQQKDIPVFGYYWEPNLIMTGEKWRVLQEPEYSEKVWQKVITAASQAEGASLAESCAYPRTGVYKIANVDLKSKAPDVFAMLQKMHIDIEVFSDLLFKEWDDDNGGKNYQWLANKFLNTYPEQWEKWVTDEAKDNIVRYMKLNKSKNAVVDR
jgi:ABC-type proline/glycine betaine transport system substrate-binding protein